MSNVTYVLAVFSTSNVGIFAINIFKLLQLSSNKKYLGELILLNKALISKIFEGGVGRGF